MLVALMAHDKAGALEIRKANREAHIAYLKSTDLVEMAGPLLGADGDMCGSLIVLNVVDFNAAEAWAAGDPYKHAGLFERVELIQWNKVIG